MPKQQLKVNDNILMSEHGAELVVVNRDTGLMFGLNESASHVFRQIRQGAPLDDVRAWLAAHCIESDSADAYELNGFLRQLSNAQLIIED